MMDTRTDDDILQDLNKNKIREYGVAIGYVVCVILVGVVGNVASVAFYGFKSHRTTTNRLITYLASTDLIACLVFSDEIIELCFSINFKNKIGCKFMYFFNHWLVIISGCMLVVICADRHRKICRPLQWQFTFTKTKLCVGGVVVFAFLTSVRDFVILDIVNTNITDPVTGRQIEAYYCTHTKDQGFKTLVTISHLVDLLTFFVVIVSLSVVYTIIACTLWKYQRIRRKNKLAELHSEHTDTNDESTHTAVEVHSISAEMTSDSARKVNEPVTADTLGGVHNDTTPANTQLTVKDERPSADVIEEAVYTIHHVTTTDTCEGAKHHVMDKATGSLQNEANSHGRVIATTKDKSKLVQLACRNRYKVSGRKHTKTTSSHKHVERNVTIMMIIITAVSILSFVPYFIVNLTLKRTSKTPEQEFDVGIQIALRSFILNNAINPYIAGIFNHEFRLFVKNSLKSILCCKIFRR